MTLSEAIVKAVLSELYGRSGFDDWWDMLDSETKQDIREALDWVVNEELVR